MPCVSQDNSLSACTVHLVFLIIGESLNYQMAMSRSSFVGIYLSFCLTVVYATVMNSHIDVVS